MTQMILSLKYKQIMAKENRRVIGRGRGKGMGWLGSLGFLYANCWNGWEMVPYSTAQGTVCGWVTLLYNRN